MIPWNLYNLTSRDQASPLVRPYHHQNTTTIGGGGGTTGLFQFTIPREQMLLLTCAAASSTVPLLNNGVLAHTLQIQDQGVVRFLSKQLNPQAAVASIPGNNYHSIWAGNPLLLLHDAEVIQISFEQAVSVNPVTFTATVSGVLIPRGTLGTS